MINNLNDLIEACDWGFASLSLSVGVCVCVCVRECLYSKIAWEGTNWTHHTDGQPEQTTLLRVC